MKVTPSLPVADSAGADEEFSEALAAGEEAAEVSEEPPVVAVSVAGDSEVSAESSAQAERPAMAASEALPVTNARRLTREKRDVVFMTRT